MDRPTAVRTENHVRAASVLPYCVTSEHRLCAGTMTDGDGPVVCACTCHPASAGDGVRLTDSPSWAIRGDGVLDEYASERHVVTATADRQAFFWEGDRFAVPHVQAALWQPNGEPSPWVELSAASGSGCEAEVRLTVDEARLLAERLLILADAVQHPEVSTSLPMPVAQRVAAVEGFPMRHDGTDNMPVIDRSVQPAVDAWRVDAWRVDAAEFRGWLRDREAQRRAGLERQLAGTPGSALYTDGGSL